MQSYIDLYNDNKFFFRGFFLWFVIVTVVTFCYPKQLSFLLVNSQHHIAADIFFTFFTCLGDGIFILAVAVFLFLVKQRKLSLALVITYLSSGILCSFLKNTFKASRPAAFFDQTVLHYVSWLPLAHHNAFPSGHTTSAFAAAATIAFLSKSRSVSAGCLLVACAIAYSRVYLGQHFIEDIWLGSLLGFSTSFFYCMLFRFVPASGKKFSFPGNRIQS